MTNFSLNTTTDIPSTGLFVAPEFEPCAVVLSSEPVVLVVASVVVVVASVVVVVASVVVVVASSVVVTV